MRFTLENIIGEAERYGGEMQPVFGEAVTELTIAGSLSTASQIAEVQERVVVFGELETVDIVDTGAVNGSRNPTSIRVRSSGPSAARAETGTSNIHSRRCPREEFGTR